MLSMHGIQSRNLLRWSLFYLQMVELGHIPCSHIVKEYEGFFLTLALSLTRNTSLIILTRCQPLFSQSNSHKGSHEEVHNQISAISHSPYQIGPPEMPLNVEEDSLMIFLVIISCHSSQPTLKLPFIKEGYNYGFRHQGYHNLTNRLKFPHKRPSQKHSRSHIIHTYKTKNFQNPKSKRHILIINVSSKDTSLPTQDKKYLSYNISFSKHIRSSKHTYQSSYTHW